MTVQLEQPFVWPEEPEDMEPWSKGAVEAQKEDEEVHQLSRWTLLISGNRCVRQKISAV